MKPINYTKNPLSLALAMIGALGGSQSVSAADIAIPESAALPIAAAGPAPGFTVRTALAPADSIVENSYLRALHQLDGTLTDKTGAIVDNIAVAGPNADGTYTVDLVDFGILSNGSAAIYNRDPADFDYSDPAVFTSYTGLFQYDRPLSQGDLPWPGIPDFDNLADPVTFGPVFNFSTEVVSYLKLSPGSYVMGVSAGFDRTDVNDDDGWRLSVGANPRSYFATEVSEFQRVGVGFPNGAAVQKGNQNEFTITVTKEGVYPFRLVQWQGKNATMLEWYLVADAGTDAETRYLINDSSVGAPVIAFSSVDAALAPVATSPYLAEASPLPGSSGIAATAPITALLVDGKSAIVDSSISISLNGKSFTPQSVKRSGSRIAVSYSPNATRTDANNAVVLSYKDAAGNSYSDTWSFGIQVAGAARTIVRGQWDFDKGNLAATVGSDLQYLDGPGGVAEAATSFGTTTDFGIPDIAGVPAKVLHVTGDLNTKIGYKMFHGIAPNGGGTRVNQFTLIMDIYVHPVRGGAASLLQASSLNNSDDGDLFWQGSNFGQGGGGYNGPGTFKPDGWHRVIAAFDEAAAVCTKYVDGIKQDDWVNNPGNPNAQGVDNARRALQQYAILFADGDNDERAEMYVNSVQIREGKLSDAEMVLLGGPDAAGIPSEIEAVSVAGQWDFEAGNLAATVGKPLEYLDGDVVGGIAKAATAFGTTTEFGIPDIDGVEANVMQVSGDLNTKIGYKMYHGIAPNGGGTRVNQFTIIFDIYVHPVRGGAASLLQASSLDNTDDGDLFWQGSNFGQGGGGYNGTGAFTPDAWHRVAAAYDEAAGVCTKYVDGIKQDDWVNNPGNPNAHGVDNVRRALQQYAILFADGDNDERAQMYVNSVQIRAGKLSDAQLTLLGGPSAAGIPLVLPASTVRGQWDFEKGNLAATVGKDLQYFDGPGGVAEAATTFGTTTDFGIPDIDGVEAKVLHVTGDLNTKIGYKMYHGIAPNGGGTRVNQFTILFDIYVHPVRGGAASLLQASSLDNTDDGDLFWQGSNFGQGGGGYNGTGAFKPESWHRVIAAYDEAAGVCTKFVDGIKQDDWVNNPGNPNAHGVDNVRRALQQYAILFADGDNDERAEMYVKSVQIREGKLSDAEMSLLGGPSAAGIPVAFPPTVKTRLSGDLVSITWPSWASGYVLETATAVDSATWTPVDGAGLSSFTVNLADAARFFRLAKP